MTAAVDWRALAAMLLLLAVAPLVAGVVTRSKSALAGRRGPPVLQLYSDLARLFRKRPVYSRTTTPVFRAGPVVSLASLVAAVALLPLDGRAAPVHFSGDLVAFAGLLALGRFALVLAALDTGSSFEGMGASREVTFAAFAEPVLFLCFVALVLATGRTSLSGFLGSALALAWKQHAASLVLVALALLVLLLTENGRVPVDDPATHLELTMIHEVMVLDHGGPDLALVLYAAALKLTAFAAVVVLLVLPRPSVGVPAEAALLAGGLLVVAATVAAVESFMARLRLGRIPQFVAGAGALALFGVVLLLR